MHTLSYFLRKHICHRGGEKQVFPNRKNFCIRMLSFLRAFSFCSSWTHPLLLHLKPHGSWRLTVQPISTGHEGGVFVCLFLTTASGLPHCPGYFISGSLSQLPAAWQAGFTVRQSLLRPLVCWTFGSRNPLALSFAGQMSAHPHTSWTCFAC